MLSKNNEGKINTRIVNLDFLRGFFIILALDQHFTYYINMWYVEFFKDQVALSTTYLNQATQIGKQIASDKFNIMLAFLFTPWVSQIYLTMACFNLASKTENQIKEGYNRRLITYGLIFLFFAIENFIVAPNTGEAISFYPIMLWMVIMGVISFLYARFGIKIIYALLALSLLRFIIPINLLSDLFQDFMEETIHPEFEYDARLEYFLTSGCVGFILGYVHYHYKELRDKKDLYFGLLGVFLLSIWVLYGEKVLVDPFDFLLHEHDQAKNFTGMSFIIGVQLIIISLFLFLEKKEIKLKLPLINWVGENSLTIFALHRILFVKVIAPISVLMGAIFLNRTLGASTYEVYLYVLATIGMIFFIQKSKISDIILKNKT